MSTIKDIAKILVEKHQLKDAAANEFLQQLVEVINDGLMKDRIVKIKGFGTFKIQEVKERSSVNVNNGEHVVIAAHDKVTFTPDAVMRDLINKPFAQFETVILNETADSKPVVEPTPVPDPVPDPVSEPKPKPMPEPKPQPEKEPEVVEEEPEEEYVEEETCSFPWIKHIICTFIIAVAFFALGFATSHYGWLDSFIKAPAAQVAKAPVKAPAIKKTTSKKVAATSTPSKEEVASDAYNKDSRVKHGAYIITGTQTTVTVRKGQTLKGISKAYLGPGMECYVEAYNGKKDVKPGDKLLIPSLKHKKRKK